jgi:hypothetical protein
MLHFITKHYCFPSETVALYPGVRKIQRSA